jgi:hypothetical protein
MTGPKENGREEAGALRRLLFSKKVLCAEQTTTKKPTMQTQEITPYFLRSVV